MSRNLKYNILQSSDSSGATAAAEALNALAARGGQARQVFIGLEQASRGNVGAIFGVAQAAQALWRVLANGNPYVKIITGLVLAVELASVAWRKWTSHQEESARAMEKAAEAASEFQAAMKSVNDARNALNLNPQIAALDDLTRAYERASKAMENMHKADRDLSAARGREQLAGIDEREAVALRFAAGDKGEESRIRFNAERERLAVKSGADFADIAAQRSQMQERARLVREQANALNAQLSRGDVFGRAGLPGPLAASMDKLDALRAELKKMGVTERNGVLSAAPGAKPTDAATEKIKEFETAWREYEELSAQDEKRNEQIKEGLASRLDELSVLDRQLAVLDRQSAALTAEVVAAGEKISAEEKAAQVAIDQEESQKRLLALKQQEKAVRDGILRSARDTAAIAEEESRETIGDLQSIADYLKRKYAHQYKYATDAGYRREHVGMEDETTKAEALEQKRWEARVARARDAQARGARGQWITQTLTAADTGKGALAAQKEVERAQQEMALNVKLAAEYLRAIKSNEEALLTAAS